MSAFAPAAEKMKEQLIPINSSKESKTKSRGRPKVLVVLGPTASGKSDLAVELARKFSAQGRPASGWNGAEIISADSRQVYRGLNIGSGKVPRDLRPPKSYQLKAKSYLHKGVPHHLLDVTSPRKTFTVAQFQQLARLALGQVLRRGKLPIICGGTGLYIDSVIYDKKFPAVPPNKKLRAKLEKLSTIRLFARIREWDPERARTIDPHNRRRLIRAIEIVEATGKPISPINQSSPYEVLKIGIKLKPQELKSRIEKRLSKRLHQGMVNEVRKLHREGLSWKRLDDLGLEYRYVSRYLRGLINYYEMRQSIIRESLRYTKRQMTWWKRDKEIKWLSNPKSADILVKRFIR